VRSALRVSARGLPADILCLSIMSEGTAGDEEDMGVYQDDMD
jgi:hypothetical protein